MQVAKEFRRMCMACRRSGVRMNREHVWPEWLIEKTRTHPRSMTVPLCADCSSGFGQSLEGPMPGILQDLEAGRGISDSEAEIFVRWLWKLSGLSACMDDPGKGYSDGLTIRQRTLSLFGNLRSRLALAVSLADSIKPRDGGEPMRLDSRNVVSAVYAAGVFGRVAVMVLLRDFETEVPGNFSVYHCADEGAADRGAKVFFPKAGFQDCEQAVFETAQSAAYLSYAHDYEARVILGPVDLSAPD